MAIEQQTAYNTELIIAGWIRDYGGQRLTISNRIVSKLAFVLSQQGDYIGDVTFEIRKVSDNSLITSKVWGIAGDLQPVGSEQWEEVTFDTPTLINEEVTLRVLYPTDVSNFRVNLHYQNTDVKAGEYLIWQGGASPTTDSTYRYTYTEEITFIPRIMMF